jgi:predicted secreted hydrolase
MWFDRQLGDLNAVVHRGWQWFAMEMNDGRSIMLFDIFDLPVETYGAVMQGADYRVLTGADFSVAVLAHWTSPATGIVYPSLWNVTVDGVVYVVTPLIADQEFREPPPFEIYWEGTCSVASSTGQVVGQAYVELNGFKRPGVAGGAPP